MTDQCKPIGQCKHNVNMTLCDECSPIKKVNFWDRLAPFTHDQCQHLYAQAQAEIADLKAKLDVTVQALEFYACEKSWSYHGYDGEAGIINNVDLCDKNLEGEEYFVNLLADERPGGKRARQALAKIKGDG